jgi:hypothetical protein
MLNYGKVFDIYSTIFVKNTARSQLNNESYFLSILHDVRSQRICRTPHIISRLPQISCSLISTSRALTISRTLPSGSISIPMLSNFFLVDTVNVSIALPSRWYFSPPCPSRAECNNNVYLSCDQPSCGLLGTYGKNDGKPMNRSARIGDVIAAYSPNEKASDTVGKERLEHFAY